MCASLQLKQGNNRLEMVNKTESILQANQLQFCYL